MDLFPGYNLQALSLYVGSQALNNSILRDIKRLIVFSGAAQQPRLTYLD